MTVNELKKYIYDNHKIDFVLDKLGCGHIEYHLTKDYFSASFCDGDNPQGINIRNSKYLNFRSWSRGVSYDDHEDIITLVEYTKKCSFIDALKYLHTILGLEYKWTKCTQKKSNHTLNPVCLYEDNPNYVFEKYKGKKRIDVNDIHTIDEEIMDDYFPLLHISWFREGIMPWAAKKFGLAYSYKRQRIIVPLRYWQDGTLMGTSARTTIENAEELGIKKYLITPTYQKNINLYGLYENYQSIINAGYCVIYEAEKSVLKRYSRNDPTGVALQGHTMSDEQVRILIGMNVDIIIAMDNDVPIEEIRFMCEKFNNIRNVYYIKDRWNLIGAKDSPADMPNKIFDFLMRFKIKYDMSEHREYLKSLSKKG